MKLKKFGASLLSGFAISLLNTLIEYLADKYQLYSITGKPRILSTPTYFFLLWIALATVYARVSFELKKRIYLYSYVFAGIITGWLFDFLAWKIGVLTIEDKGSPLINALVWILLVPLTIFLARLPKKLFSKI